LSINIAAFLKLMVIKLSYYCHQINQMWDAFKQNFLYGAAAAVAGTVYIIYMVVVIQGAPSEVIGFMMAMSNTYGQVLISLLMGNGLVALPRRLWQLSDGEYEQKRLYIMVSGCRVSFPCKHFATV
jgi:ABC-type spermidine/putrescine transport system permease subunit II